MKIPEFDPKCLGYADEFLREFGVLSDAQKNTLILNTLCEFPRLKNVALDINQQKKIIVVTLYFSRWWLQFTRRRKLVEKLRYFYRDYLKQNYEIRVKFARYVYVNKPEEDESDGE